MSSESFKTLHVWDTKFSADSVEWCPVAPFKNVFACGTYFLNENTEGTGEKRECERTGTVTIFNVIKDKLEMRESVNCPAVLDMKWSPKKVNGNIALVTGNAAGEVDLFYFDGLLTHITKCLLKTDSGDFLVLSLDWIKTDSPDLICASDSQGNITLIKVASGGMEILKKWKGHSLEAWIVSFDSFSSSTIYSGGDEGKMKVWDCRSEDALQIASPSKHTAGVTALNSNTYKEGNLVSGSYDETVLFWDVRTWKSPVGTVPAGGGLWRLKWEPRTRARYVLGACIYGGFQIFDTTSYTVVAHYKEHQSLAYGADWSYCIDEHLKHLLNVEDCSLIATCSFYDHKLCVSLWTERLDV